LWLGRILFMRRIRSSEMGKVGQGCLRRNWCGLSVDIRVMKIWPTSGL
jgi:hypothetical protein